MSSDGKLKHGVKYSLYFLLRTSVDYLVGYHNTMKNDEKVNEFEKFIKNLEFHKDIVFGDAIYAIELSRLERLRVPENRILEEDIETLREHTLKVIRMLTCEYTFIGIHEYVLLRDALCSRITLYNARRGGEPSRLKMSNFTEAKNKRWLDKECVEELEEWEQNLFKEHLITYQPGKGSHLVPVLIPKDCVAGQDLLCCSDTRQRANVLKENKYLFPNTGLSADHTSGWNATHRLAKEANVKRPDLVNATKQRHRISTLYCALDIPEEDRQYFYKHMGHSKEVNWGTNQYPLPVLEMTKVGKHLQDIDKGRSKRNKHDIEGRAKTPVDETKNQHTILENSQHNKNSTIEPVCDLPEDAEDAKCEQSDANNCSKATRENSGGDYFRWSATETEMVKRTFKYWIEMPEGNVLPGKKLLEDYINKNNCRFTVAKLRTKIMNEQYKCQRIVKERMSAMAEKS